MRETIDWLYLMILTMRRSRQKTCIVYIVDIYYSYSTERETFLSGSHSLVFQSSEVIQPNITIPRIVPMTIIKLLLCWVYYHLLQKSSSSSLLLLQ